MLSPRSKAVPSWAHFVNHQQDPYGDWQARLVFPEPVREFKIEVDLVADMSVYNPFDFFVEDSAKEFPLTYDDDIAPISASICVLTPLARCCRHFWPLSRASRWSQSIFL